MAHRFINEIQPGENIIDIYLIRDPILRSTTKGDLYIAMYLSDRTGQLNARMWQATETVYKNLPNPGFVYVHAKCETYQNNLQIIVNSIQPVEPEKVSLDDFLAKSAKDTTQMFQQVKQILAKISHPQLNALVQRFLADKELMDRFCNAPAAIKLHHNYLAGLLEHTHNMLLVADAVLPFYPQVQPDLVLAGVFLHDIGKTSEISYDMAFAYTDSGQLIGHIVQSLLMLKDKAQALAAEGKPIDPHILDALGHIILSHHGQYEFGSPKLPATAEAYMVNYIDDLDAKLNQVNAAIDSEQSDSNWTAWKSALQTRLYKKRIQ